MTHNPSTAKAVPLPLHKGGFLVLERSGTSANVSPANYALCIMHCEFIKCEASLRHHNFGKAKTSLVRSTNITCKLVCNIICEANIIQRSQIAAVPYSALNKSPPAYRVEIYLQSVFMKYFFSFFNNEFFFNIGFGDFGGGVGLLFIIDRYAALLHKPPCFAVGFGKFAFYH